jgi:hypothetical protein
MKTHHKGRKTVFERRSEMVKSTTIIRTSDAGKQQDVFSQERAGNVASLHESVLKPSTCVNEWLCDQL